MKYTFEIMKEYEDAFRGISVYSVSEDKKLMVDFVALEELEDAQKEMDEAYQRGYDKGYVDKTNFDEASKELAKDAYQRGLDDAWEAAKKISLMPPDEIEKVFPGAAKYNRYNLGYSGVEVIAKLKAYEERQETADEINVGDEVDWEGDKFVVTRIFKPYNQKEQCDGVDVDGCVYDAVLTESLTKTGRHFGIGDMLKGINWT